MTPEQSREVDRLINLAYISMAYKSLLAVSLDSVERINITPALCACRDTLAHAEGRSGEDVQLGHEALVPARCRAQIV